MNKTSEPYHAVNLYCTFASFPSSAKLLSCLESNLPKLLYCAKSLCHALTAAPSSVSSITFGKPMLKKESGVKILQQTYLRSGTSRINPGLVFGLLSIRATLRELKMERWKSEFSKIAFYCCWDKLIIDIWVLFFYFSKSLMEWIIEH